MASEQEKPRVTEIKVRMDCNGCVQKVKKALHGIIGITELYVDFPQQKVTIVGWADPEKIIKAIKKTRKSAVICLHSEQSEQSAEQNSEAAPEDGSPEGGAPPSETTNQGAEPQQTEQVPLQDPPNEPSPTEYPSHEANPPPDLTGGASASHTTQPSIPKDEEVHVVYHYPPDHGYRYAYDQNAYQGYGGPWSHPEDPRYRRQPSQIPGSPGAYNGPWGQPGVSTFRREPPQPLEPSEAHSGPWAHPGVPRFRVETPQSPQPVSVSHSYNTYKPSPFVTEYAYPRPPSSYNRNYARQGDFVPRERQEYKDTYRPSPTPVETQEYNNNTYRPSAGTVEIRPIETQDYNTTTHRPAPSPVETRPTETREYINMHRTSPGPVETHPTEPREYINTYRPPPGPVETRPTDTREYINTYRPSPGPIETREYNQNTYRPSPSPIETREYSYNCYRPSPYTTEYAYSRTPSGFNPHFGSPTPPSYYSSYSRPDNFNQEYYNGSQGNGNVTSMFSEENPNACTIV